MSVGAPGERLLHQTTSLCLVCKNAVPADVWSTRDAGGREGVWMAKVCPQHGSQQVQLSNDVDWYEGTRTFGARLRPPRQAIRPVEHGCPFDCGPCELHEQKVELPVVTITSACN